MQHVGGTARVADVLRGGDGAYNVMTRSGTYPVRIRHSCG